MSHQHSHESVSSQRLTWAIVLTCAFVLGEAIAGVVGHSVALLSDAGHNLADAAALGFSLYAVWLAKRPSDAKMTFGYHRATILAALVNAVSLVAIAVFILSEAIARLRHPSADVSSKLMIVVALCAVAIFRSLFSIPTCYPQHCTKTRVTTAWRGERLQIVYATR